MQILRRYTILTNEPYAENVRQLIETYNVKYTIEPFNQMADIMIFVVPEDLIPNIDIAIPEVCHREIVFTQEEIEEAEWLLLGVEWCQFPDSCLYKERNPVFNHTGHRMIQLKNYEITSKIRWPKEKHVGTPLLNNNTQFMFIKRHYKDIIQSYVPEIQFRDVIYKKEVSSEVVQMIFPEVLAYDDFVFEGGVNIVMTRVWEDGRIVYIRERDVYIPKVKRESLRGHNAVSSDSFLNGGAPYLLINHDVYSFFKSIGLNKSFNYRPIPLI